MNGAHKFHKVTGPAFKEGEEWVSSNGVRCWIVKVEKYPNEAGLHSSDFCVTYRYENGFTCEKDAWSFQVRYMPVADLHV
jgi:hypothetical protein